MPTCMICGENLPDGSRTCPMCGTSSDDLSSLTTQSSTTVFGMPTPVDVPTGGSYCPNCVRIYGSEYRDEFCSCGTELLKEIPTTEKAEDFPMAPIFDADPNALTECDIPMAPILDDEIPMAPILDDPSAIDVSLVTQYQGPAAHDRPPTVKPDPGTPCIVLYGADKRAMQYFALTKDTTLIGRLDAVAGNFPDVDLSEWFDRATIRRISRQHALILRSRATKTFALRPLVGNTGTQLENTMIQPQRDYPLQPGCRIILGGVIRLKFEIA